MSPLMIGMILHIHAVCEPYADLGGRAQRSAFQWLRREGLIEPTDGDGAEIFGQKHRTTDRGAVLVAKLCNTPLPLMVMTWE